MRGAGRQRQSTTPPPGQDGPQDDPDDDGLTNAEEFGLGTDRMKQDTDDDGVLDGQDGWPLAKFLNPPRLPVWNYAVIELVRSDTATPIALNNNGHENMGVRSEWH
jgi:hypothetical protein